MNDRTWFRLLDTFGEVDTVQGQVKSENSIVEGSRNNLVGAQNGDMARSTYFHVHFPFPTLFPLYLHSGFHN